MSLCQLERSFQTCRASLLKKKLDTGVTEARKQVHLVHPINNTDHMEDSNKSPVMYNIA